MKASEKLVYLCRRLKNTTTIELLDIALTDENETEKCMFKTWNPLGIYNVFYSYRDLYVYKLSVIYYPNNPAGEEWELSLENVAGERNPEIEDAEKFLRIELVQKTLRLIDKMLDTYI